MSFTSYIRILRLGIINFWRNRWLSLAAILIMTLTLLIISFFAILNIGINAVSDTVRSRLDLEVYFFDDKITDAQILDLSDQLKARTDVKTIRFVSKEDAKKTFTNYEIDPAIINQINSDFNPLPRSLLIKANDPEQIPAIVSFVKGPQFKDIVCQEQRCISYNYQKNRQTTTNLLKITNFIKRAGIGVGIIFVLVSIMIILNTIRMTMYTRRDEIEIMKLVGASHAFIRYPFIIESILYGVVATILSLILIALTIRFTSPYVNHYAQLINLDMLHYFLDNIWLIIGLQLSVSLFISIFCSVFSIRRHLKT